MKRYAFNEDWKFSIVEASDPQLTKIFKGEIVPECANIEFDDSKMQYVRLPHTAKELPYNNFSTEEYQLVCCYRKIFDITEEMLSGHVFIEFGAIAHRALIYVNGNLVADHGCGYTAIRCELTDFLSAGRNVIAVIADSRESLNVPPFGYVIDYLTYSGIYREVFIEASGEDYIEDVFCHTSDELSNIKHLTMEVKLNRSGAFVMTCSLTRHGEKQVLLQKSFMISGTEAVLDWDIPGARLWDIDEPNLYDIEFTLKKDSMVCDSRIECVGFRKAQFTNDGFLLNGRKLKLRGLNRHQAYPYIGYAMPGRAQEDDVNILKELGVNIVRTSHYPQSRYFIRQCDEKGLLVFTEMPGWQHIGDISWQDQAVENVREMILQYRNHPSIIIWGVRINESQDNDDFYIRTNELAHKLDPYRPTGGVRNFHHSSLLEDVYTFNDFVHEGDNQGLEAKEQVTSDMDKPYMVTEHNGHMYPVKPFDCEELRLNQAKRHARVLDDAYGNDNICSVIGWCMFDYNTHKDFGSGDNICYHGVLDMFRNPKMAAYLYASQQEERPVLHISSSMDIGEHPAGIMGDIYAFTNGDKVRIYRDDQLINEVSTDDTVYKNMPHGPVAIGDQDAMGWGGAAADYRFEALRDGEVIASAMSTPEKLPLLKVSADRRNLTEVETYDVSCVRIKAVDKFGNVLHYYQEPVILQADGAIKIIGPRVISLKGGMGGTYVKTTGVAGPGSLNIIDANGKISTIEYMVEKKKVPSI